MGCRRYPDTICRVVHGRAVFQYANGWRAVLCLCSSCTSRMGSALLLGNCLFVQDIGNTTINPMNQQITGWSNFLGQVTGPCSVNYVLSSMILTAVEIANSDYTAKIYHVYLLFLALLIVEGLLTMNSTKFIGYLNKVGTVVNMAVIIFFVIWLPVGSINQPKFNSNDYVWTGIVNGTEWPSGFAFMMGFLSVIWTMAGYDAPFHLSEECSNANIASPRAIVMTAQLGLYLGWAIILVIA